MPYIGTSPSKGVRRVLTYTATASQTTFTGASSEGVTLSYADTNYIDVFQNGVLLGSADYTSTSGTSVVLAQGASADDLIVITVYDVFGVADTISKKDGGTFDGNVTMGGTLTVSGAFTSQGIDDNADATAITIDSSERVNIGTGTPPTTDSVLTVQKSSAANEFNVISSPSHASVVNLGDTDDYNICRIKSDNSDNSLQFQTNNSERMRLNSDGDLFLGTTSANSAGKIDVEFNGTSRNGIVLKTTRTATGTNFIEFFNSSGTNAGEINHNGSTTVNYSTSSDYRLKENVSYNFDATTRLKQLKPARFNFIADGTDRIVDGFLAHEVQLVVPEAITGTHNGVEVWKDGEELPDGISVGDNKLDNDGNTIPKYQSIDQSKLVPLLVKTIQELEARITALESK